MKKREWFQMITSEMKMHKKKQEVTKIAPPGLNHRHQTILNEIGPSGWIYRSDLIEKSGFREKTFTSLIRDLKEAREIEVTKDGREKKYRRI